MKGEPQKLNFLTLLVFLFALLVTLPFLSYSAVFQVSEAREGVVVNEILSTGDLILPKRNGEIVPSKPILFHWLGALGAKLNGSYGEFELRLPSALSAATCLAVFFSFMARILGLGAASFATLVLLTNYGFYRMACDGRVDMVMICFTTIAVLLWWQRYIEFRQKGEGVSKLPAKTYWLVGLCCGLACLAKGPLGVVLPAIAISSIVILEEGPRALFGLIRPGLLLAVLIPLPWYLLAGAQGAEAFYYRHLFFENLNRFVGGEGISVKPPWFYLVNFWSVALPWSVVFAVIVSSLFFGVNAKRERRLLLGQSTSSAQLARGAITWLLVGVVLFSLSAGKRRAYLVPLLPAFAIFVTAFFYTFRVKLQAKLRRFVLSRRVAVLTNIAWLLVGVLAGTLSLFAFHGFVPRVEFPGGVGTAISQIGSVLASAPWLVLITSLALLLPGYLSWRDGVAKGCAQRITISVFCLLLFVQLVLINSGLSVKGETHTYRDFAKQLNDQISPSTKLYFVKKRLDESYDGLFFYSNRRVEMIEPEVRPQAPGAYLARRAWLAAQELDFKEGVVELLEGGRKTDEPLERLVLFQLSSVKTSP